jgi:hypothetical protein
MLLHKRHAEMPFASNAADFRHRIIRIHRCSDELNIVEDDAEYNGKQMTSMFKMLDVGIHD